MDLSNEHWQLGGSQVPIGHSCYVAEADINRDGVIDYVSGGSDYALAGARSSTLAPGEISAVLNVFGWNGAVFDAEGGSNGLYLMRMRHYSPAGLGGRWLQRDPAGYMDSANLYGYVAGNPIGLGGRDPYGLQQAGQQGEFVGADPVQFGSGSLPTLGMLGDLVMVGLRDIEVQDRLDPWKDIAMVDDPVFGMPSTWRMFRDGLEDAWTIWEGMCNRLLVNDPDVEQAYQYTMAVGEHQGHGDAYKWSRRAMKTSLLVNPMATGGGSLSGAARWSTRRIVASASGVGHISGILRGSAAQLFDIILRSGSPAYVYLGIRNGVARYVGITGDLARRAAEHGSHYLLYALNSEPLTRWQARAIEQALIHFNRAHFDNVINSIWRWNPFYRQFVAWGAKWLRRHGYPVRFFDDAGMPLIRF